MSEAVRYPSPQGVPRASLYVRLSKAADDENTSKVGMIADLRALVAREGFTEVALHIDDGKSGGFRDRPEFIAWLADAREGRADVLVAWHVDRMTREGVNVAAILLDIVEGKNPATGREVHAKVRLMDCKGIDSNNGSSFRMKFVIAAEFAREERERMRDRNRARAKRLRETGRWSGGTPPYGYTPEKIDKGWTLTPDPASSERVKEIVHRIIAGESMNSICQDFNARGIPTPSDHYRASVGKPMLGHHWKTTALIPMLRSRTLIGEAEKDGKTVIGKDDKPVSRSDHPIISYAEWRQVQDALDKLSQKKTRTAKTSPLLGIAFCECGDPLYRVYAGNKKNATMRYQYYRCRRKATKPNECTSATIRAETLEAAAEESTLALIGGLEVLEKRLIPGDRHAAELAYVESRLRELREDRDAGLYEGEDEEYQARFLRHRKRRDELAALPNVPDRWEDMPTGRTYRELWDSLETAEERRAFLLASGVRVIVHAGPVRTRSLLPGWPDHIGGRVGVQIPPDIWRRVEEYAARMSS